MKLEGSRGTALKLASLTVSMLLLMHKQPEVIRAQDQGNANAVERSGYVGDSACAPCHKLESEAYRKTAHHLTSQVPASGSILGSFSGSRSTLSIAEPVDPTKDPRLYFQMSAGPDGFYETAYAELGEKKLTRSERIDVVVGSGVRGQTYLYWKLDRLFELPVSYWSDGHQWINSPGYLDGTANFSRKVDPRCMECHATFLEALSDDAQTNAYDKSTLVFGISCESCHGPGLAHVKQESKPKKSAETQVGSILNPHQLDRDRQVDQCALCHNGTARREIRPAFSYKPGDDLERYFAPGPVDASNHPDVHGDQVGLLKRSKCFVSSPSMSCSTCHNVHTVERPAAEYSAFCLSCHQWQSCGRARALGENIKHDCIDCHMPLQETNAIVSNTAGKVVRASIRSHWIKIYPE